MVHISNGNLDLKGIVTVTILRWRLWRSGKFDSFISPFPWLQIAHPDETQSMTLIVKRSGVLKDSTIDNYKDQELTPLLRKSPLQWGDLVGSMIFDLYVKLRSRWIEGIGHKKSVVDRERKPTTQDSRLMRHEVPHIWSVTPSPYLLFSVYMFITLSLSFNTLYSFVVLGSSIELLSFTKKTPTLLKEFFFFFQNSSPSTKFIFTLKCLFWSC